MTTIRYHPSNFNNPVIDITLALQNGDSTTISEIKEKVRQSVYQ